MTMPIPKPKKNESEHDFIERCMSDDGMKEDHPDNDERLAICYDSWRKKKEKKKILGKIKKRIDLLFREEGAELEDWLYLIHHLHTDSENGKEIIHHCFLVDHLGNLYQIEHITDEDGNQQHCLVGLAENQEVYWSDEEAEADGQTIPCANRQLED